ncbi:MAG TPA: plastocyanin/azurin family copper-binding protein [Acidimicrobiales bacterium]|nr:plastocyanin/azurin family copper-binding protein [Acidimicrobiales bacterium]
MTRRALLLLALLVGACGGGDDDAADAPTTTSPIGVVSVQNSSFAPPSVSVKVGQKVTWTFRDSFSHTATADDGSFDSGRKSADATYEHTFATAGTFTYKCTVHPSMTGTVGVS